MSEVPAWVHDTLRRQLEMNPQTWDALREHGVDESTDLQLEFFYVAPGEADARALAAHLDDETDYDVAVKSTKSGMLAKRRWSVTGTTKSTTVSLDILNQWVQWMVVAGAQNGGCDFDGWGAEVAQAG